MYVNNDGEIRFKKPRKKGFFYFNEKTQEGKFILENLAIIDVQGDDEGNAIVSINPQKQFELNLLKENNKNKKEIQNELKKNLFSLEDEDYKIIKNMEILLLNLQSTMPEVNFPYDITSLYLEREKKRDKINELQTQLSSIKTAN